MCASYSDLGPVVVAELLLVLGPLRQFLLLGGQSVVRILAQVDEGHRVTSFGLGESVSGIPIVWAPPGSATCFTNVASNERQSVSTITIVTGLISVDVVKHSLGIANDDDTWIHVGGVVILDDELLH